MAAEFSISWEPPWNDSFLDRLEGEVGLDCADLAAIDTEALRVLLHATATLDSLRLVSVAPHLRGIFESTDTTSLLERPARRPLSRHRLKEVCDVDPL